MLTHRVRARRVCGPIHSFRLTHSWQATNRGPCSALIFWRSRMTKSGKFAIMAHKSQECAEEALTVAETLPRSGNAADDVKVGK
jgi:hypothetical protein